MPLPAATRTPFASPHLQLVPSAPEIRAVRAARPSTAAYLISQAEAKEQAAERVAFAAARRDEIAAERWAQFHAGLVGVVLTLGLTACAAVMFGGAA